MLALEGQHLSEVDMSDREIGVELNRLPSEAMRAFEGSGVRSWTLERRSLGSASLEEPKGSLPLIEPAG